MSHEEVTPQNLETSPGRIGLINDRLRAITFEEIEPLLEAKLKKDQAIDANAGIAIVKLAGKSSTTAEDGQVYDYYAALVLPASKDNPNYVNPHVHFHGAEPYHFLRGTDGEMNNGIIKDGEVIWNAPKVVQPGDMVEIQGGEVHSFRNKGSIPFAFTFACPPTHLTTDDRVFTKDLKNGIPPWYLEKTP